YTWEVRYAGYRWDGECGLYHVRHRGFHSVLGCWLQRDPQGLAAGGNLYEYGRSRPVAVVDPAGLEIVGATVLYATGGGTSTAIAGGTGTGIGLGVVGFAGGALLLGLGSGAVALNIGGSADAIAELITGIDAAQL